MMHARLSSSLVVCMIAAIALILASTSANAYELQGRVLDYLSVPVEGARVWVSHDRRVYTATTDADGHFLITDIEIGKIEIVAMKDDNSIGGKEGQLIGDDTVTIQLDKGRDLPMRIINYRYEPVNGARLKHLFINDTFTVNVEDLVPHGFPSIRSNAEGIMILPNMPRFGFTSMSVTHPDYAEGLLPTFPIGREIDMVLVDGVTLRGRITSESNEGIPRARVALAKFQGDQQVKFSEVLSDADGFYSISAPPAHYVVAAKHRDFVIGEPVSLWLRAGEEESIADLQLLTPHRVVGRMTMESGDPVSLVHITYRNEKGVLASQSVSDRDGRFAISIPTGNGTLIISPPDGLMTALYHEIPVDIHDDGDITLEDILLRPLPAITGIVLDEDGNPVPKAFVRTIDADPPVLTQSDANGQFYIQLHSLEGSSTIQVYAEDPYRFTRAANVIDLRNLTPQTLQLENFRPKLGFMPELASNNLSDLLNEPAPEWVCSDWFNLPEGVESISLVELKGKTVVLTLWAGFDLNGKTRRRMDELRYLYGVFGQEDDIAFVSIHDASLKPFEVELILRNWNLPFPVGCDDENFTSFQNYKVNQIPQTVIIDAEGNLKYYEVEGRLHTLIKAIRRRR